MDQGSYDYLAQERVIWGRPAAEAVVEEADRRRAQRVFIVASKTLNRTTDIVTGIAKALGPRHVGTFDGCQEHTPRPSIIAAAEAARAANPDLVLAIGGGTVIDTVKVMLICLAHDIDRTEDLDAYHIRLDDAGRPVRPQVKSPPCRQIAVPTTLSGAEFSNLAGATDPARKIKDAYTGWEIGPAAVILDPAATVATPDWLWFSTAIRAVDHAVESVCSIAPAPIVDGAALHALRLFAETLPRLKERPDDLASRLTCQQAVWLASAGIARVPYGASHGIGHSLGAVTGMSHGQTSCIMLPAVLAWNETVTAKRQAWVSEAMGRPGVAAATAVADLVAALDQPRRLSENGVSREQFADIAAGALTNLMVRTNPRRIDSVEQIVEILERAW